MPELSAASLPSPPKLPAGGTFWVAFSGGLDSTVLLHLLKDAGLPLKAVHVNHGLQPAATGWVGHCRAVAAQFGVPLYVVEVEVNVRSAAGPEAAAREARQGAFRTLMKAGDCLVTAHQQDDQAETVLLRLLRGSGVGGLASMRTVSKFASGMVWRPLLGLTRKHLRAHAERHHLRWVEDPHNRDPRYSRSYLRMEIFSRLVERWPGAVEGLARTAEHCSEAVELLDAQALADLRRVRRGQELGVKALLALPRARRNNLLRFWIAGRGFELPPAEALGRIEREVLRARPDRAPVLAWGGSELRRFRDSVYAMARLPAAPGDVTLAWSGQEDLSLPPGCGRLALRRSAKQPLALEVRFGSRGERLKPGAGATRALRNLFQESATPGWIRERLPRLYRDGELVAVADRWATPGFKALCRKLGLRFVWEQDLPGDPGA